jgi:aminopeptidase N
MRGWFSLVVLMAGIILSNGQGLPSCPRGIHHLDAYQNPLYSKWLSSYDVKSYHLGLHVSNTDTKIEGSASILIETVNQMDTLVLELQNALEVERVLYSDDISSQSYREEDSLHCFHLNDAIYIVLNRQMGPGELFQVLVRYGGEAGQNRGFFAGIQSSKDLDYGFHVTYTLSEPLNAKDWFPVKQVLEDKIDSMTFRIRCSKELLAGSNGLLADVEEAGEDHIYTWHTRYPMAYYLVSFAVADYRDFSFYADLPGGNDSVLVQNYIYDSNQLFKEWEEQIRMTGPLITSFSGLLTEYPFAAEKYGHAMAPMGGGMEHQTMTTLQNFNFYLVAHELAHQWFGDHITCGNWQDIWINEGFASYFEYVAAQELLGQEAADAWMDNAISIALRETSGSVYVPGDRVEDSYRLFDYGLSYKKGATLLHMIRFILNDDARFFRVLRSYLETFGNGLATGEDFRQVLESVSGTDFSCFFEQWYYGEGFPRFTIYWQQEGDSLKIQSEQAASASMVTPLFQIPFELEVRSGGGANRRFRFQQQSNFEAFSVPVEGRVEEVLFDPGNHLLATSSVIQQLPSQTAFRFGPNPVAREIYIQVPNAGRIDKVRITSMAGQEVMNHSDLGNPVMMDLSSLADGPYLLELSNTSGTFLERIVKISAQLP